MDQQQCPQHAGGIAQQGLQQRLVTAARGEIAGTTEEADPGDEAEGGGQSAPDGGEDPGRDGDGDQWAHDMTLSG
ncbi:hypothetical protein D3C75_918220 [compost metagenome]